MNSRKVAGLILVLIAAFVLAWFLRPKQTPEPSQNVGWKTATNAQGIKFQYPETLSTTYIHTVDWPPVISVTTGSFTCVETGQEIPQTGQVQKRVVNNRTYCVTKINDGAAGSTYTQYLYTSPAGNNKVVTLAFTLRFVQCGNYEEPKKTECTRERETFDVDSIVDRIVQTI